jgi:hypothetical protein
MKSVLAKVHRKLTSDVLQRAFADVLLLNVALIISLLARLVVFALASHSDDGAANVFLDMFSASMRAYAAWAGVLSGIGAAAFATQGFIPTAGLRGPSFLRRPGGVHHIPSSRVLSLFLPIASDLAGGALLR